MPCPRCHQDNPPHARFCLECSTPLGGAVPAERSHAELQAEIEGLKRSLSEALEQQTATSEILGAIARSPAEVQPVLDTVAESATRLCDALDASIFRVDDAGLRLVAHHGPIASLPVGEYLSDRTIVGRSVTESRAWHIADVQAEGERFPEAAENARGLGSRALLTVPMIREGVAIGALALRRTEPRLFTERQIALLQTFADQAVIAIVNVRLFTELEARNKDLTESLEQQTATSEILRVISSSPTDLQPVFDTIVRSVARLCDGLFATLHRFDGELLHWVAQHNYTAEGLEAMRKRYPMRPSRDTVTGRTVNDRTLIHIRDFESDPDAPAGSGEIARAFGYRTLISVPMLRQGQTVGAIAVARREGQFSAAQITLLHTFADQAVIAIENVRLFTELQEKNSALTQAHAQVTEALDQQTATSEILRVISRSPTDLQPVFDSIAASALRLCDAKLCTTFRFDGELIHLVGSRHVSEEGAAAYRDAYPSRPGRQSGTHRAILTRAIVHIPDIREDAEYELRALARANDYGCVLSVPMLRDGHPVGAITVGREAARPFSDAQIELLKTFADQAVIAIENVRLFTELEGRNRDLTATSEILRVISRSPTDVQPVFDAIADSALRLCDAAFGAVFRFDDGWMEIAALAGMRPDELEAARRYFPRQPSPGSPGLSHVALTGEMVHIPDVQADARWRAGAAGSAFSAVGFRTCLIVPLSREGRCLGAINVWRREASPFSEQHIELLKTFADQAVIAIENVRLFKELEIRNRELTEALEQQTATSELLKVIGRSTLDLQPVFQTLAE